MNSEDTTGAPPEPEALDISPPRKNAFVNAEGVLTSWGYQAANGEDTPIEVAEDFDLEPGKWRLAGGEWVAHTVLPTQEEVLSDRDRRLARAAIRIAPLQDAVELGDATPEEGAALTAWRQYRVALNRIEQQAGFPGDVEWPQEPA